MLGHAIQSPISYIQRGQLIDAMLEGGHIEELTLPCLTGAPSPKGDAMHSVV